MEEAGRARRGSQDFTAGPGVAKALRALLRAFSTLDLIVRGKMVPQSVMEMCFLL